MEARELFRIEFSFWDERGDAWNASVRTRGTAADRRRRVRRIVRRVGGNATKSDGGLRDDSLCRIRNCDIMEQDFAVSGE